MTWTAVTHAMSLHSEQLNDINQVGDCQFKKADSENFGGVVLYDNNDGSVTYYVN